MLNRLYLDCLDLMSTLDRTPILRGEEVLGPKERLAGSVNHEYRKIDDGTFLQLQDFTVVEPYEFRQSRKNFVLFQFTKKGKYQRLIGSKVDFVNSATVQITNVPEAISFMPERGARLLGVSIGIRREYLIDRYGLNLDSIPAQYRRLFASESGLPCSWSLSLSSVSFGYIEEILDCSLPEPLRSIFLRAKALSLICDVVSSLTTYHQRTEITGGMERQMIDAAAAIYAREIDRPPSVSEVAARVGLQRNRFIAAFQDQFDVPPSAYFARVEAAARA